MDKAAIENFARSQIKAWNAGDKDAFFAVYRAAAPNGLDIEHPGQPHQPQDGWAELERIWAGQSARIEVEIAALIVAGNEVAMHNLNKVRGTPAVIHTIELYKFVEGKLYVRFFINHP